MKGPLVAMTFYPHVLGEHATLEMVHQGWSLSRIGDGETSLMAGGAQFREPANPALAQELRAIAQHPIPRLLVGIPTLIPGSPKYANWLRRAPRTLQFVHAHMTYGSAFVSRPDSAAENLRTDAYCQRVVDLWRDKRTVLVSEYGVAIYRLLDYSIGTGTLCWIACPHRETYAVLPALEAQVLEAAPEIAILSCGPAATCLAARLTRQGVHAVDIGSAGHFILRQLTGIDVPLSGKES
jgi:hypothetical protein